MYFFFKKIQLSIPDYYNRGNSNNCFLRFEFPYGTANGYEKRFVFTFLHPKGFCCPYIDRFNGHHRFHFGCGMFTISFDWFNRKSIYINNL